MNEQEFYDVLYGLADTVIELKEITPEEAYRNDVHKASLKSVEEFFNQLDNRISCCDTEEEQLFVKETSLNFLLFALKKIIVHFDVPDENIEILAEHVKKQILLCKRN